jgi:glycerol-3-phosphate acyltransferase PlsY
MPIVAGLLTLFAAYLLGSIPSGFLAGRARGIDIRTQGSGNIGATNVTRALGKTTGILVFLADAAKGWAAVILLPVLVARLIPVPGDSLLGEWLPILAGIGAVLGHNYTCWLNFKGGKGVSTTAGVLLGLAPLALAIIFTVFLLILVAARFVSLASICAAVTLPFATWLTGQRNALIWVTSGLAVLAIFKHRGNIRRLLNGTEHRFGRSATPKPDQPPTPS